ncbi:C15orf41 family protein [archaeon]|nr:C15orf41 family protein [archaeon]
MDIKEYKRIYKQLNTYSDVKRITKNTKMDEEFLFVVYTQKHIRDVKRKYYVVGGKSKQLLREWKKGKTFTELAVRENFSPVMMAQILMKEMNIPRKERALIIRDHEACRDTCIRKEMHEVIGEDMVYSQLGSNLQRERGRQGEENIKIWLDARKMTYRTEEDLRGEFPKTVDFLLDKPFKVRYDTHPEEEREIHWIESKGSFGDTRQITRDYREQLSKYVEMWGPGMVVYWFDYLDGLEMFLEARDVKLVKRAFFYS